MHGSLQMAVLPLHEIWVGHRVRPPSRARRVWSVTRGEQCVGRAGAAGRNEEGGRRRTHARDVVEKEIVGYGEVGAVR